jgi:hypothetical protein
MSDFYNPKKTTGLYDPKDDKPYKISRSRIEAFLKCPKCFYIDRKFGTAQPPGYPFNLNSAVDKLLKQEFDWYRERNSPHPLQKNYQIDAVPARHEKLDDWRNTFKGVQFMHEPTNFLVYGGIDDLWINSKGEYMVVDYKATAKFGDIKELNAEWQNGYKRQMEVYQWLLRKNGLPVSNTGYFVYCNGKTFKRMFNARLEFDVTVIPHVGNDEWVEPTIFDLKKLLDSDEMPKSGEDCDFCAYVENVKEYHI